MSVLYQHHQRSVTSVPDIGDLSFDLDTMEGFQDMDIKLEDLDPGYEEEDDVYTAFNAVAQQEEEEAALLPHGGGLALFEFDRMRDLSLDLDPVVARPLCGEKRALLLEDMDSGRDQLLLRQDCMWSSVHSGAAAAAKFFKSETGEESRRTAVQPSSSLLGLTPPTSYIHQHLLLRHQFETPLASSADEDGASVGGSSSPDEVMMGSLWSTSLMDAVSRLSNLPLSTAVAGVSAMSEPLGAASRDHSYFSCVGSNNSKKSPSFTSVLTPPESSEDEDSYQGYYVSREAATALAPRTAAAGSHRPQQQNTINSPSAAYRRTAGPVRSSNKPPKFTFRINIRSSSAATKQLARLARTSSHNRRRQQQQHKALVRAAVADIVPTATMVASSMRLESRRPATTSGSEDETSRTGSCSGGLEPKGARDIHNHNERQRRTDLKNAFEYLKRRVPSIAGSERASKQMILDKAIDFCKSLKTKEAGVRQHHKLLAERNELLRKKLQTLQL
jgi:hypothetical protein